MDQFNQFSCWESGQGVYGQGFGQLARADIDLVKDKIVKTLDSIPANRKADDPFTITDYGTADGFTSMPLIKELVGAIRKKHGEIPIQIVYEEQASSDFNSLMKRVHGIIPDPYQYVMDFKQVYPMATGTSFFEQILPNNSAHLILSFLAVQYLSKPAVKFQNSLERFPDATESECQLVVGQMAKDWETFLLHRAAELKSGGVLIVSTPAYEPEMNGQGVRHTGEGIVLALLKAWRQMRDEGKITKEEFVDTNFYRCFTSMQERKAPFEDPQSKVSKAGLRLFQAETVRLPCLVKKRWKKKLDEEGVDDRTTWAQAIMNLHTYWSSHAFIRGLASTRSQHEKEALVKQLNKRVEKEVLAQGPMHFQNDAFTNYTFIRKI